MEGQPGLEGRSKWGELAGLGIHSCDLSRCPEQCGCFSSSLQNDERDFMKMEEGWDGYIAPDDSRERNDTRLKHRQTR